MKYKHETHKIHKTKHPLKNYNALRFAGHS